MIRIALCGQIDSNGNLATMLSRCATDQGFAEPVITCYDNPTDLVMACTNASEEEQLFDVVMSALSLPGISGMQLAVELSRTLPVGQDQRFVLCAPDATRAREAAALGVHAYLLQPLSQEQIDHIMGPLMQELTAKHESSIVLNCRDGLRRIEFAQLSYIETSGRDQLLHCVSMREPAAVRLSSRAMFTYLENDGRFYKLGSSYIVNLDHVSSVSLRNGTVTLFGGTQVTAPVRLRKSLAEALCNYALVSA